MIHTTHSRGEVLRNLGNGLILRRATVADAEALVEFNARIHGSPNSPDHRVGIWTRDLMTRPHPTCGPSDFTIVEESATGKIVSSLNLISQTWTYGGISFGVGQPDLVGTEPEYRNRRLVRAQFEVIHQWSARRGEMVQAITGIPYYYRLFGYEMALPLYGERVGHKINIHDLNSKKTEPYFVRAATEADLPFMAKLSQKAMQRYLVACLRDEVLWRYELLGRSEAGLRTRFLRIIETAEGERVGFLVHPTGLWKTTMAITQYELKSGVSWLAVTPSVIRYLWATGEQYAKRDQKESQFCAFSFALGGQHPAYQAAHQQLPQVRDIYAWYVRVPDLPGFLQHLTPVFEQRLAESIAVGHTGELKISFYRGGLHLRFEKGRLTEIKAWKPKQGNGIKAAFPDLTFLQLLFGYRSLEELEYAFADCWTADDEARVLLNALFPKWPSNVWSVS